MDSEPDPREVCAALPECGPGPGPGPGSGYLRPEVHKNHLRERGRPLYSNTDVLVSVFGSAEAY